MRANFLIATEDDATAEALGALFFALGFFGKRVTTAGEGLLELDRASYDVVLADQALSDVPGGQLPRVLAERGVELPVIVLVPAARVTEGLAAVRAGAADFLRKPVEREEVLYVVRKALRTA